MMKCVGKINGCQLILAIKKKYKIDEEYRIRQAEEWLNDWIKKGSPNFWYYSDFGKK